MTARSAVRALLVSVLAVATIPALLPGVAHAATAVNCPGDNLQTAINNASSGDTLDVTGTCTGSFVIDKSLTLQGGILDGSGSRTLAIGVTVQNPTPVVNLNDLGLIFGQDFASGGGNLRIDGAATVTLTRVTVAAGLTDDVPGGGIYNNGGTLSLADSAVADNLALPSHGSPAPGGGIYTQNGALTLTNSTVAKNFSSRGGFGEGGGIFVDGSTTTLINDTIAQNVADGAGGGIYLNSGSISATATIIQANGAPSAGDCNGITTSGGYNLVGSTLGCAGFGATDLQNVSAKLDPFLQGNGGPTENFGLLPGSPAIGAIPLTAGGACLVGLNTDQRGVARPQGKGCDIGAVEKGRTSTTVGSSDTSSISGQTVTFTATVCANPSTLPATPTGTVKFRDGGGGPVLASGVSLAPGGGTHCAQAQLTTSSLSSGRHKIVAIYSGDGANFRSRGSVIQRVKA
jgi:Bacterial Ig-like domain (group 3)